MARRRKSQSSNQPASSDAPEPRPVTQSGSGESHGSRSSTRIAAAQSLKAQKRKSSPSVEKSPMKRKKTYKASVHLSHATKKPTIWFVNRSDTELYKHRRWLEAGNFGFRKKRNFIICVLLTKKKETSSSSSSSKHNNSSEVDWQVGKSVTESISIAQNCDAWSDISFLCYDQDERHKPIKAHKFILASRSPVFEAMFFGPMKETNKVIKLEDISSGAFKAFLRFLYSDKVDLNFDVAEELIYAAHKYRVTNCVEICTKFLLKNLNGDNALKCLQIATLLDLKDLEIAAMKRIRKFSILVFQSEEFLSISRETLKAILKDDDLNISSEEIVFKYVDRWAAEQCKEKRKKPTGINKRIMLGEDVFNLIRFTSMSAEDFVKCMLRKEYLFQLEYEAILVDIMGLGKLKSTAYGGKRRGKYIADEMLKNT